MSMISTLIENLEEMARWDELTDKPKAKVIREATDTIKELSAKLHAAQMDRSSQYYNGGWIPLEEYDPPKENGLYEVTAYWHETWQVLQAEYIDGHWWVITRAGELKDIPVVAWAYIRKPYQPKEREK